MKKIIVTAFQPFNGMHLNSSSMILDALPEKMDNITIKKVLLPVLYKEAFLMLKNETAKEKYDFIVCMGQAGGRACITIEKIAVNINHAKASDNRGVVKNNQLIDPNGQAAYFTNLPIDKMLSASKAKEANISYSAGTYVCNDIFYRLMQLVTAEGSKSKGGFIHLPYTEHFKKQPYMDLEKQTKTIKAMLCILGEENGE